MRKGLLTSIFAVFILALTSNCAGIKPFFQAGNAPGMISSCSKNMKIVKGPGYRNSYVPSSAEENGMLNLNRGQYKFSVSFPASVTFEF